VIEGKSFSIRNSREEISQKAPQLVVMGTSDWPWSNPPKSEAETKKKKDVGDVDQEEGERLGVKKK